MNLKSSIALAELYCTRGEKCIFDVKNYLIRKKVSADLIESVILQLVKNDFLNEERYVKAFVHDKILLAKWGPLKVKSALLMKGLNKTLIEEILLEYNDQAADFEDLALKKWSSIKGETFNNRKQKLIRFLLQKGFQPDLIFKWLEKNKLSH